MLCIPVCSCWCRVLFFFFFFYFFSFFFPLSYVYLPVARLRWIVISLFSSFFLHTYSMTHHSFASSSLFRDNIDYPPVYTEHTYVRLIIWKINKKNFFFFVSILILWRLNMSMYIYQTYLSCKTNMSYEGHWFTFLASKIYKFHGNDSE